MTEIFNTQNPSKTLKSYIWHLCKTYKIYLFLLFVISISASFFEITVYYKIKELIDIIAKDKGANISMMLVLFVLYKFLQHGMFFVVRILDIAYKPEFRVRVTSDIYNKTIKHSLHWFDSHMSGEISEKINSITLNLSNLITNIFRSFVILWAIVIGLIFLFKVSYWSAVVQLGFLITYTPIFYFLLKKQLILEGKFTKAEQEVAGVVNDSISNIYGIKIIGNIASELKLKLIPALLNKKKWDKKTRRFDAFWVDNIDTFLTIIMSATQIYLLAYLYKNNLITAGGFAFVAMIMLKVHSDIDSLLEKVLFGINPQIASIKTSYEFVNQEYDILDNEDAKDLKNVKGEIEFKNINFAYEKQSRKILNEFSLKIEAGEKIGLVGHSGAGKTTLVKSLIRYFDIDSGANISVIPQDITMFHRSILDNLRIAKYDATEDEIIEACKKAKIHDDILTMKDGYNSIVGERGIKVSGGQRQRIAIARAILKDAPILILDEATSSLDSRTEKQIQESLNLLIADKSKTVIAIAHRLSTLKNMDRIIVIDQGKIAEIGTHFELLQNSESLYKKLWELQEI